MTLILSFIVFILLCFLVFYLPGRWLLSSIHYKALNTVTTVTLSLGAGIAIFLIGNYILAWIQVPHIYLLAVLLMVFFEFPQTIQEIKKNFSLRFLGSFEFLMLLVGSLVLVSITAISGMNKNGDIVFYGVNALDGIYHSALIGNLTFQFPASFPGLSNTMLRGYHFLYDFMLSRFTLFFGFNSFDLYFRFFSLFTALFYGLAGLTLSYSLKMDSLTRRVFLFLLFFAQGAEFFIFHWFHGADLFYGSGIVQPAGNIVDPSVLFSMSFVFLLYVVLFSYKRRSQLILPVLFLGIVPGIKIYTAILTYAAFFVVTLISLVKKKITNIIILVAAGVISFAIYAPFNLGAGSLIFNPLLFFRHFMESDRVLASFQWILKLQVYEAHRNIFRITYLYAIALLFYFIPSLGIRLVSLMQIKRLFNKDFYTPENTFWIVFILTGLLIPAFFIQSVAVFNTVQFYWLIWIALLIPTAFSLVVLIGKPIYWKIIVLFACLVVLSLPIVKLVSNIYHVNVLIVSKDQSNISQSIQSRVPHKDDVLIVNRSNSHDSYSVPLFGALAERPFYYEPEAAEFSHIQQTEKVRQTVVDKVSYELTTCSSSSETNIIKLLKHVHVGYMLLLQPNTCMQRYAAFEKVATSRGYSLYKLKQ